MVYKYTKTVKKTVLNLLIWGLPQLLAFFIFAYPKLETMSVAALFSLIVNQVVDWLKHRQ